VKLVFVPQLKYATTFEPFGLTVPFSVAEKELTELAAWVVTVGDTPEATNDVKIIITAKTRIFVFTVLPLILNDNPILTPFAETN
jgi:hypothetical protein